MLPDSGCVRTRSIALIAFIVVANAYHAYGQRSCTGESFTSYRLAATLLDAPAIWRFGLISAHDEDEVAPVYKTPGRPDRSGDQPSVNQPVRTAASGRRLSPLLGQALNVLSVLQVHRKTMRS